MTRKDYERWVKFDWNELKIYLYIKRAEMWKTTKNFAKYIGIPQNTIYSFIHNWSMERSNYKKMEARFSKDERFTKIFNK